MPKKQHREGEKVTKTDAKIKQEKIITIFVAVILIIIVSIVAEIIYLLCHHHPRRTDLTY